MYRPLPIAGNYFEQRCADGTFNCVPTIAAGLNASNVGGSVSITQVRIVRCLVCEEESVQFSVRLEAGGMACWGTRGMANSEARPAALALMAADCCRIICNTAKFSRRARTSMT